MGNVKLRDLERFKKTLAGTIEFASLIEQASQKNRERIIAEINELDPGFMRSVMKRVVFFEELVYLDEGIVAEILGRVSPKLLAFALAGMPEDFQKKILNHLSYRSMKETLDEQDKLSKKPSEQLIHGARSQVLRIARELEAKNKFVFELADCPRFKEKPSPKLKVIKGSKWRP